MTLRVEKNKWILYRHTSNFDLITAVAVNLKFYSKTSISKKDRKNLLLKLKELSYYRERNPELPLDSINHRINTLAYYMFGYKEKIDKKERFLFSPLGNLFLKNMDDENKKAKIFLTMLWAMQFQHPHGGTNEEYQLYPFRLIFKLLSDNRLGNKLFAYEVAYKVVFIKTVTNDIYENLVNELLELRKLSNDDLTSKFQEDVHAYVNSIYEWDTYVSKLFSTANVLEKTNGEVICKLQHGNKDKHGNITLRKVTRSFVEIPEDLKDLVNKLESSYSYLEKPLKLNDPERLMIDVIKEIYSFYPKILLDSIGEVEKELKLELLNLTKLIEQYSNNNDGAEAYLFEDVLTEGFNQFYNVEAEKVGGAGNTDIECLYLTKKKKFAVDAKSTKNKLSGINSGRLAGHRDKIGGEYTIVVAPRYVPAVLQDIQTSPIVIIRASTLSEYLYNCIDNNIREIDFEDFDSIITNNLGTDISKNISNMTIEKFATTS